MKVKSIFAAALAAMMFASCSNDDNEAVKPGATEDAAKMNVSFTLPKTSHTRADGEQNATAEESAVKAVDVFIFDQFTGTAVSEGGYKRFASTEFSEKTPGSGVYTLNEPMETVSGNVTIYVALNLPATYSKEYGNTTLFHAAVAQAAELDKAANGFTMFSAGKKQNLQTVDSNESNDYVNTVSMSVDRVVSKVVASTATATYDKAWSAVNGSVGFEYTIKEFNVFQEAIKTYLAPNASTLINSSATGVLNSFETSVAKSGIALSAHPADDERVNMAGFYVGENTPEGNYAVAGNTTYTMVSTTLKLDKAADWNADDKKVVYAGASYGNGTSDIFVVKHEGITYVTDTKEKAELIGGSLKGLVEGSEAYIYTYKKGYVHFIVWLNKEGANDYRVGRNEFIHAKVNGINLVDGVFPGYPGNPENPEKPINPTEPGEGEGENPGVIDPEKPVDPASASLNVEITINPWTYKANEVILE